MRYFLLASELLLLLISGCKYSATSIDPNESVLYSTHAGKVRGLDPGDIGDETSNIIASQMIECLYQYHYLKRPYQLIPCLAESMPSISDDGLTYTIKIKKGVRFCDDKCFKDGKGRELKAGDFVYAWKRIADIKYISNNWWIFDGKIIGLDEFRQYSKTCKTSTDVDYNMPVGGLQTPDDWTLVIKLKKPWPQIIDMLAHTPTAPMAKEAVEYYGKDIINHPVGTGPYMLKLWHKGSYIEMVKNPNFRDEYYPSEGEPNDAGNGLLADAGKKLPLTNRIISVLIQEDPPHWFLFMQGKIDVSGIPKDNFAQAIDQRRMLTPEMQQRNIKLLTYRDPDTYWIGFNMEDKVLGKNLPLRMALSCAVDRDKYIELFTNNRMEPAYGFIPPLMGSYNPDIKNIAQTSYNVQKAREYVKEAERITGGKLPTLTLTFPSTDAVARQEGDFFKKCFDEAGLDVEMDYMDWPTFQEKVKSKSAQMFMLGWIADIPDTENFLALFYSKNVSPGSNSFNYSNPEFDKIYEKASIMSDSPERDALYKKAEEAVVKDCPAIFLIHGVAYVLTHDWALNIKPHAFAYNLSKYRRIDLARKNEYQKLLKSLK